MLVRGLSSRGQQHQLSRSGRTTGSSWIHKSEEAPVSLDHSNTLANRATRPGTVATEEGMTANDGT